MRRKNREVTDREEIKDIIRRCGVCRLALFDGEYPYLIPLNFGFAEENGNWVLYFHGANAGKKLDLIKKCRNAAFEMDCSHQLVEGERACDYTMAFESVCGTGAVDILPPEEKAKALTGLMARYTPRKFGEFTERELASVTLLRLTVREITAKRHRKSH